MKICFDTYKYAQNKRYINFSKEGACVESLDGSSTSFSADFTWLVFITKLLGKNSYPNFLFEYIVGITIGDIAGTISMDVDLQASHGVVAILVWASFLIFVSNVSLKVLAFEKRWKGRRQSSLKKEKFLRKM